MNQKGFIHLPLLILGIIVVVFAIGLTKGNLFKTNLTPLEKPESSPSTDIKTTDEASLTETYYNDGSEWKSHTNEKLGVTFDYPPNSILSIHPDAIGIQNCVKMSFEECKEKTYGGHFIQIEFLSFSREGTVPKCIAKNKIAMKFNGISWNVFSGEITEKDCPEEDFFGYYNQEAYTTRNETYIEVTSGFNAIDESQIKKDAEIFKLFLSSFKFI